MQFLRKANLKDEHRQEIKLYKNQDGYWWAFSHGDGTKNGPYVSQAAAYSGANAFCNEGAP